MQPGQVAGSSGQLTQLASMQLNSSSTGQLLGGPRPAYTATAPSGITGVTSLYGKLRTALPAAALSAQPGDAQPSGSSSDPLAAHKTASLASSVGTGGYGWQGQKGAAASATSSDASSILQPQAASISQRLAPLQSSLFSQSSASGSHASSLGTRSTTSSVAAADQAPAGGFAAAVPVVPAPDGATAAATAVPAASAADHKLLEALRMSASTNADTPQDQQAMLSLLLSAQSPALPRNLSTPDPAAYGTAAGAIPTSAQLLLTPPTVSSAEELAKNRLLQQLQQMYINESVHAGQHSAQGTQAQAHSGLSQPNSTLSQEAMQQQLLMLQLQELQESQARSGAAAGPASTNSTGFELLDSLSTLRASAVAVPQNFLLAQYSGSTTAGAGLGPDAVFSFQHATMPMQNQPAAPVAVSPGLLVLGAQRAQSDSSNEQLALAQLIVQYGQGASAPVGNSDNHSSMLYSMPGLHSQMPGGPAGLTAPSTGSASLAAAIEEFQQKTLLSSSGLAAAAPGGRGVFDSLAGLAAASADVGGLSGLLPAGKHTLQVGPGNNPMYKTEMCRTWMETGGCRYGSRCQFAHGPHELRPIQRHPKYKTQPCRTFSMHGSCPYGDRCNFIHDQQLQVSHPVLVLQSSDSTGSTSSGADVSISKAGSMLEPCFSLN